jgi:(2Fe-2S) ferredoxin
MSRRKRYLFVCVNRRPDGTPKGSCAVRGAEALHARLKERLKDGGLAEVQARACTSSCHDVCWAGPSIAVLPDGYFYGRVGLDDVEDIVQALAEDGRVERLVLADSDFVEPRHLRKPE